MKENVKTMFTDKQHAEYILNNNHEIKKKTNGIN